MKKLLSSLFLFCAALAARADTFSLFSPSDGILVGDSDTYITTSAVSADVRALWSGTCDVTTFLRGDGSCAVAATSPAGSDTQVQYNNAGAFGASANLTWNNGTGTLAVSSDITVGGQSVCLENGTNCQPQVTPAGSDTQIQFNDAGAFGASANFTWDNSTSTLNVLSGSTDAAFNVVSPGSSVVVVDGDIVSSLQLISASEANLTLTGSSTAYIALGNGSNDWYIELDDPDLMFLSGPSPPGPIERIRFTPTDILVGGESVCLEDGTNCPGGSTIAAAGANTQVQYNNGGVLGASANFTFNSGTNTLTATNVAGAGSGLTALNATQLTSGTVPDARFPATLPAVSGANLTSLNATQLTSGTIPDARFPATLPAVSGANLTNLNATNISSGTLADGRLSSNVPLKNAANTFTASQTITGTGGVGLVVTDTTGTVTSFFRADAAVGYFGTSTNDDLQVYTNNIHRGTISAGGNWTIHAPSSGVTLTQNVLADVNSSVITDGTRTLAMGTSTTGFAFSAVTSNHGYRIYTNNTSRIETTNTGSVAINTPTSGNTLTLGANSGNNAISVNDGTTSWYVRTSGASGTTLGNSTNHSMALLTNNTNRITIGSGGGVQFGSPTGGDQGAGTLNTAGGIYTNGALISPIKMVSGYCSSSGTPGCANLVGYGGASVAYSSSGGTGQITVTFSGFTDPGSGLGPQCVATSTRGVSSPSFVEFTSSSYTVGNFVTRNTTTGTAENQAFRFICTGT